MPTYAYECETGHEFDLRQGFHDEPIADCPTCSQPARRVFHPASVHYKGSGFYTTDYARKSSPSGSDSGSSSGSGDSGSSAGESGSSAGESGSSAGKSDSSAGKSGSSAEKSSSSSGD